MTSNVDISILGKKLPLCQPKDILAALAERGWILSAGCSAAATGHILSRLGRVVQKTDICVRPESRSLVTSAKALGPHTDHHKVDLILWHCVEQTDQGGETLLVDARKIYARLSAADQNMLRKIYFYEHKIFPDDPQKYPMISGNSGEERFYYTYWLLEDEVCFEQKKALDVFHALASNSAHAVRLRRNDVLVIDNRSVLHGRHAIAGSKNRHLRRYWIQLPSN